MLGRVDRQGSLLETRFVRRHLVTKGSFYERLADHGHEIVADEDFADLYADGKGRPSIPPTGKGGRQIVVGRHHARIEAARAAQVDPDTKTLLRRRPKVERKIDHLQDLGMRKARFRGRRKTLLQALLAATVANFKRLGVLNAFENPITAAA